MPAQPAAGSARGPEKAPEAFRTISEVSEELDLPQHVLRFWETRFVQVRPLKRGGGRRLYRPDHVALLRGIKALLHEDGMTIKGVQKVLRDQGPRSVIDRGRSDASLEVRKVPEDATERLAAIRERISEPSSGTSTRAAEPAAGGAAPALASAISRLEALLVRLETR